MLSFDGCTNTQQPINIGIPQDSPTSPILFQLYLYPLFNALQSTHPTLWARSYIDNIALVTHGQTCEDNAHTLTAATCTVFQYANNDAITFDDNKSELLHFYHARQDTTLDAMKVQLLNGIVIKLGIQE
jgi:hypothetical protein